MKLITRTGLAIEFLIIFVALPLGYRFAPMPIRPLPVLWLVAAYALWALLREPAFDRTRLWNWPAVPSRLAIIFVLFAVVAFVLWLAVRRFVPGLEWLLFRQNRAIWAMVMVAYPVLSVYPQEILYRAFFFQRYASVFKGPHRQWSMILASAAAFAFLHIIFRNWLAIVLTFGGGVLFAARYEQSKSLAATTLEHSLYGCWLFTVGLGQYFYHGAVAIVGTATHR